MSAVPARARRHPMTAVIRARELASGGWSIDRIVEMLGNDGITVSRSTVFRWTNSRQWRQAAQRDHARRARGSRAASARPMGHPLVTPEYKLGRMQALRENVGLKDAQIARLMGFDFGDEMSRAMVAHAFKTGHYPRTLR